MYSKRTNKVYFKFTMTHWKLSTAITQTQPTHCNMIFETNSVLVQKKKYFYLKFSAILVADMHADAGQMTCTQVSYWLLTLKNTCTCRCTYFFVDWANACSWEQRTFVTTIKSTSIYNTNQLRLKQWYTVHVHVSNKFSKIAQCDWLALYSPRVTTRFYSV